MKKSFEKSPGYYHVTWETGPRNAYRHSIIVKINRKKRGQEQTWEYAGENVASMKADFPVYPYMQWTPLSGEYVFGYMHDTQDCFMSVRIEDGIVRIPHTCWVERVPLDDFFATRGTRNWRIVRSKEKG